MKKCVFKRTEQHCITKLCKFSIVEFEKTRRGEGVRNVNFRRYLVTCPASGKPSFSAIILCLLLTEISIINCSQN